MLPKNSVRLYTYIKSGFNETYFRENIRLINYGVYKSSSYDFSGIQLGLGLTDRITIEHDAGFFFKKQLEYNDPVLNILAQNGKGISNGIIGLKYLIATIPSKGIELIGGVSVKYPYSTKLMSVNRVELPIEIQPSTRAWGMIVNLMVSKFDSDYGINYGVSHKYEKNFSDPYNYKYGSINTSTFFISRTFLNKLSITMNLRNEFKLSDTTPTGAKLASEGSNLLLLSPTMDFIIFKNLALSLFGDVPVYKYYFGEQLSIKYAIGFGINYNIQLSQ